MKNHMKNPYLMTKKGLIALFLLGLLASCGVSGSITSPQADLVSQDQQAVTWILGSNQYPATTIGIYGLAQLRAEENLANPKVTAYPEQTGDFGALPPAVILDLDETVLNNIPLMLWQAREGMTTYDDNIWRDYVNSQSSLPIAGSVEFVNWALEAGIAVFFVTNRGEEFREATLGNLRKIGIDFPNMNEQSFFKATDGDFGLSDKYPRYSAIAKNHRIILIVGDNYSDFVNTEGLDASQYKAVFEQYKDYVGRCWIVLPNPLYGDWEKIQGLGKTFPTWTNK